MEEQERTVRWGYSPPCVYGGTAHNNDQEVEKKQRTVVDFPSLISRSRRRHYYCIIAAAAAADLFLKILQPL